MALFDIIILYSINGRLIIFNLKSNGCRKANYGHLITII